MFISAHVEKVCSVQEIAFRFSIAAVVATEMLVRYRFSLKVLGNDPSK